MFIAIKTDLLKWYHLRISKTSVSSADMLERATLMCAQEGYASSGIKDKYWLESFKKRHRISFQDQPFNPRKLKRIASESPVPPPGMSPLSDRGPLSNQSSLRLQIHINSL